MVIFLYKEFVIKFERESKGSRSVSWECIYFIVQNDEICEWKVSGLNFNW